MTLAKVGSRAYKGEVTQHRKTRISVRLAGGETPAENVTLSKDEEKAVRKFAKLTGYQATSTFIREVAEYAGPVEELAEACHLSVPEYLRTVVLAAIGHTVLADVITRARRFVWSKQ